MHYEVAGSAWMMTLETNRLILRRWEESDAPELYKYASNPVVGNSGGWLRHRRIEDSLQFIWQRLDEPEAYAIVLKDTGLPIGSISLTFDSDYATKDDEAELGYWLGVPYWGNGLMTEAVAEILRHAFENLQLQRIWASYFDGNKKSEHVLEKVGFKYQLTESIVVLVSGGIRTCHVTLLTKAKWNKLKSQPC